MMKTFVQQMKTNRQFPLFSTSNMELHTVVPYPDYVTHKIMLGSIRENSGELRKLALCLKFERNAPLHHSS